MPRFSPTSAAIKSFVSAALAGIFALVFSASAFAAEPAEKKSECAECCKSGKCTKQAKNKDCKCEKCAAAEKS